jgi:hypothetical protein
MRSEEHTSISTRTVNTLDNHLQTSFSADTLPSLRSVRPSGTLARPFGITLALLPSNLFSSSHLPRMRYHFLAKASSSPYAVPTMVLNILMFSGTFKSAGRGSTTLTSPPEADSTWTIEVTVCFVVMASYTFRRVLFFGTASLMAASMFDVLR